MTSKAFDNATDANRQQGGSRNRIINGDMRIAQRGGGPFTSSGEYPADRFFVANSTDGAFSAERVAEAPDGFQSSVKITTTTADTSLTTTQNLNFQQRVEGYNVDDLDWGTSSAKTATLSFWVRSSLTGTFGGSFRNNDSDRSYPFTYSISSADTWEYKTVTVEGDTSGTWLRGTSIGVSVFFGLGAGPDRSGTAGAWNSNNNISATGAVSVIGTLNATWQITGVQLEVGTVATPFEHRSYGEELALCQRYYFRKFPNATNKILGNGGHASTTQSQGVIPFPVTMRVAPTALEQSGTANHYCALVIGSGLITCNAVPTYGAATTEYDGFVNFSVASGLVQGQSGNLRTDVTNGANAYLGWSAEL